jgi:hypothetical protein
MKKQFYIKQEDQANIISAYMLECGFQIGKSTYIIKIDDKTNKELCIIILVNKDNGTIAWFMTDPKNPPLVFFILRLRLLPATCP